jgi:hypothetical protein
VESWNEFPRPLTILNRENVNLLSVRVSERFDRLDKQTQKIISALTAQSSPSNRPPEGVQDQILALTQLLSRLEATNVSEHRKTRAMVIGRVGLDDDGVISANPEPLEVLRDEEEEVRLKVQVRILESLRFSTITSRYEDVSETYNKTFNWIFYNSTTEQRPWSSFNDWLISGSGVYWINGKAGSGKSTLMRHIIEDGRTERYLVRWAKSCSLSTAKFFFWNSGSREQRSQTGLLRGLLYEVLSKRLELIPVVFPQYWAKTYTDRARGLPYAPPETWPLSKLMAGFKALVTQKIEPLNLCLFIDGLDEYDGDHAEMAELFKIVTSSASVKACISSRPWVVFEETFQTCPGLRLQELTRGDIEHFTTNTLHNSNTFKRLALQQPALAKSLIEEIVEYSSGVFLWVRLVVKSLLDGLRNRDGILDLQKRLRLIPRDLESLYDHMLALTGTIYIEKASRIFQIFRAAMNFREVLNDDNAVAPYNLTVLALALAINDDLDLDAIKATRTKEILTRCEDMQVQLVACCAGLLELGEITPSFTNPFNRQVGYLHRSARDFIERPDMWTRILGYTRGISFNPNASLLKSTVCQVHLILRRQSVFDVAPTGAQAMVYAYHSETETRRSCTRMLDELDRALTAAAESETRNEERVERHWTNFIKGDFLYDENANFLSHAVQFGLSLYVAEKCQSGHIKWIKGQRPLLDFILVDNPFIYNSEVAKVLIQYGANPNMRFQGDTLWERGLRHLYYAQQSEEDLRMERRQRTLNVVEAFVRGGGDPKAHFKQDADHYSALRVITYLFEADFPEQVRALQQELTGHGASFTVNRRSMMGSWFKRLF